MTPPTTPDALLAAALAANPSGPLLTHYDDSTGERVELSATTVENWVAKTANLLQEAGIEPGARVAVLLPQHWQGAVVLLGCWRVGAEVVAIGSGGSTAGGSAAGGSAADVAGIAAVFAAADRLDEADAAGAEQVWGLSLAPLGAPMAVVPPGVDDYAVEVRGMADRFAAWTPADPDSGGVGVPAGADPARTTSTLRALAAAGVTSAAELGLGPSDRVLVVAGAGHRGEDAVVDAVDWLLAPIAARASIVLVRHPDADGLDRLAATERITHRLRG